MFISYRGCCWKIGWRVLYVAQNKNLTILGPNLTLDQIVLYSLMIQIGPYCYFDYISFTCVIYCLRDGKAPKEKTWCWNQDRALIMASNCAAAGLRSAVRIWVEKTLSKKGRRDSTVPLCQSQPFSKGLGIACLECLLLCEASGHLRPPYEMINFTHHLNTNFNKEPQINAKPQTTNVKVSFQNLFELNILKDCQVTSVFQLCQIVSRWGGSSWWIISI